MADETTEIVKSGTTFSIKTNASITAQVPLFGKSMNSKQGIQQIWAKGEAEFIMEGIPQENWGEAAELAKKQMDATKAVAKHGCGWTIARDKNNMPILKPLEEIPVHKDAKLESTKNDNPSVDNEDPFNN